MRTITDAQSATYLSTLNARACWAKVEVYSTITTSWVDLTSYLGYNWVRSVSISETVDSSIATAEVEFFLLGGPQGELTSSPFVGSGLFSFPSGYVAYGALLSPWKQIRIYLAVTPRDVSPSSSDWMLKFRGRIAETVVRGDTVRCNCRDEMGDLADAYIEAEREYGDSGGSKDVEDVIQDILNDWGGSIVLWSPNGTGGTPFNASDSPGWATNRYLQQRQSVMDAIRVLADQIGYDLRFRWQTNAADLKLVLTEPARSAPSVVKTFSMSDVYTFTTSLSVFDIRNAGRVLYTSKAGQRLYEDADNSTSITNYGRRYIEISEEVTSQIDTSTEADNLITNVIADLALPTAKITCDMSLFPNVELMDYYTFTGDNKICSDLSLSVVSINHRVLNNTGVTSLTCTGAPASRRNWANAQQVQSVKPVGYRNNFELSTGGLNLFGNGDLTSWTGS